MESGFVYVFANRALTAYNVGMTTRAVYIRRDELQREYGTVYPFETVGRQAVADPAAVKALADLVLARYRMPQPCLTPVPRPVVSKRVRHGRVISFRYRNREHYCSSQAMSILRTFSLAVRLAQVMRFLALLIFFHVAVCFSAAQTLAINGQAVAGFYTNGAPAYVSYTGATAGQYVCINITTNNPDLHFIPEVGFPGSLVIGSRYGSRDCDVIPANSGQIEIYNYGNPQYKGIFGYTIQLSEPRLPYAGGGGVALSGTTNTGTISGTNVDLWTFSALKGDPFRIQFPITNLQNCTSDFCAQTILVNPDGTLDFASGSGGTPGGISYIAPQSGTYYLYVYSQISYLGPTSGNYSFTINLPTHIPPQPPSVTLLDPITTDPRLSLLAKDAVTVDKSKLAQGGSEVTGIAADGAAELVIRIAAASLGEQFTISQSGNDGFLGAVGSTPVGQGDLLVTADYTSPVDKKPYAFALYKAPANFVRSGSSGDTNLTSRQVSLAVTVEGSTSSTLVPITIWRPPVVLIHGIWSSPSAWKDFAPLVSMASDGTQAFDSRFDGYLVDYHDNASDSISSIVNMDNGALSQLIDDVKSFKAKHQAAAVQADVVAHSMGGLVTRDMALSPSFLLQTYGKGLLHKVITIGTPHSGTPVAGRLLNSSILCRAALLLAGHAVAGAVTDLQPNSALISSLSSPGVPLQAHALAGDASTAQEVASEVALDGVGFFVSSELNTNVCFGILPLGGYQQLYGGDSDLLVPLSSQTYGFDNPFRDVYPGTEHTIIPILFPLGPDELNRDSTFSLGVLTSPGTSVIPNRVIDLLNASFAQQDFTSITP